MLNIQKNCLQNLPDEFVKRMSTKLLKRSLNSLVSPQPAPSASGASTSNSAAPSSSEKKKGPSKQVLKRQAAKLKKKQALERAALRNAQLTQQRNLRYFSSQAPPSSTECMTQVRHLRPQCLWVWP